MRGSLPANRQRPVSQISLYSICSTIGSTPDAMLGAFEFTRTRPRSGAHQTRSDVITFRPDRDRDGRRSRHPAASAPSIARRPLLAWTTALAGRPSVAKRLRSRRSPIARCRRLAVCGRRFVAIEHRNGVRQCLQHVTSRFALIRSRWRRDAPGFQAAALCRSAADASD